MTIRAKVGELEFEMDSEQDLQVLLAAVRNGKNLGGKPISILLDEPTADDLSQVWHAVVKKEKQRKVVTALLAAPNTLVKDSELASRVGLQNNNQLGGVIAGIARTARTLGVSLESILYRERSPAGPMFYALTLEMRECIDNSKIRPTEQEPPRSMFAHAQQETERIGIRIDAELAKWPMIHWLTDHFGGLVYWAGQKLIDRANLTGEYRAKDRAICETCPRLFSDCFAGYLLVRKGLVLQSAIMLRSTFETVTQAILFMSNEEMAEKWLKGKWIKPKDVQELTSMPETERRLYRKLSNLSHPNYRPFGYDSAPVPGPGTIGKVSFYGGWFAPKQAGQIAIQFLWAELVFLEHFYATYSDDLRQHGLLWRRETVESAGQPPDDTWQKYFLVWRDVLTKLTNEHDKKSPEDILDVALAFSTYEPEEKEIFRRAFAEIEAQKRQSACET
jgi:hypothetical protein